MKHNYWYRERLFHKPAKATFIMVDGGYHWIKSVTLVHTCPIKDFGLYTRARIHRSAA